MISKKIILAEFSVSHSDILHTVVNFLTDSGYEVHLWINSDAGFDAGDVPVNTKVNLKANNSLFTNITFTLGLLYYIIIHNITRVFINTAHGLLVRNFCLFSRLFSFEVTGLMHHGEKLKGSKTQDIISGKIKKYFVLSDFIKENLESEYGNAFKFSAFYPVILKNHSGPAVQERDYKLICIPGEVSDKRKNYQALIDCVKEYSKEFRSKVKFDILGRVKYEWNKKYISEMNSPELKDLFITYDKYISNNSYFGRLSECDVILPLIIPGVENFENYLKYQISGAYNMAYIFKKPLLLYDGFRGYGEFEGISLFFNEENLGEVIMNILNGKEPLEELRQNIITSKRLDFEYQRKKFKEFLELEIY